MANKFAYNKSKALRVLQGNAGRREINTKSPKALSPEVMPDPPEFLDETGVKYFNYMGSRLQEIKVMTANDWLTLGFLSDQVSLYVAARRHLEGSDLIYTDASEKTGMVRRTANPAIKIMDNALTKIVTFGDRFGLSPVTRSRTEVVGSYTGSALDQFVKDVG